MSNLIYITEDDQSIRELIKMALTAFSFEVKDFENAEDMLAACEKEVPALALFDIMLPGMSGIEAVKILRKNPATRFMPIIMLTAKDTEADKVTGLDIGADDYITKPFGVMELASRVKALLRRSNYSTAPKETILTAHDLTMNVSTREVTQNGRPIELTLKEFELLKLFLLHPGQVISREELLDSVWGYDYVGETRTLDMHIRTLRQKLSDNADQPKYIKTIRGVGYRFNKD